jgi:hypothetical protein
MAAWFSTAAIDIVFFLCRRRTDGDVSADAAKKASATSMTADQEAAQ